MLDEEPTPDPATSPTECSVTGEELAAYLRRRFPDSPDLRVTRLDVVPGGRSKETLLVSLAGTTELPAEVIVRKDRPVGLLETRASDEFAILRAVHAHGGVPVAEPFFADDAKNLSDDGVGDGDDAAPWWSWSGCGATRPASTSPTLPRQPPEYRQAIGTQLATAFAHLHAVPLDTLAETGLDVHASVSEASLSAAVNGMAARIDDLTGPPIAAVPLARQWLLDHIDDVVPSGPLCLLQGDFGLHNTLVDGDRVTALVDWEAATVGPRHASWQPPGRPPPRSWTGPTSSPPTAGRRFAGSDGRAGGDVLPGLLRARGLHVEPNRRPPVPHRRQAGPADRALGARRPLPGAAQPGPGAGRRGGPHHRD